MVSIVLGLEPFLAFFLKGKYGKDSPKLHVLGIIS